MVYAPSRPVLTIALGVLLLLNPLYIDGFHLDEPNSYRYESAEVTYGEDGIETVEKAYFSGVDDDVACLTGSYYSRTCVVERGIYNRGNLTVSGTWGGPFGDHGPLGHQYAYLNDSFYETEVREVGDKTVLSLNRTPADVAMRRVSTPVVDTDRPVRKAVRTGSVRTRHRLDAANRLLWSDGTYYVVYLTTYDIYGDAKSRQKVRTGRRLETGLTVFGIVVGFLLVFWGHRRLVRRELRRELLS